MGGNATLQAMVQEFPDRGPATALVTVGKSGVESWSYGDLAANALAIATGLTARGIGRGDSVAIVGANCAAWVAAFLGIVTAGAAAAPLDPRAGDEDLAFMLETAACRLMFTSAASAARLKTLVPSCRAILLDVSETDANVEGWRDLAGSPDAGRLPRIEPEDRAVIVFTSGTTGTPKAVPLSHANLMSNVAALAAERLVDSRDRALLPLPLHHVYPLTVGLLTPLACGAAVVFPAGVTGPDLAVASSASGATILVGVPRLYSALVANLRAVLSARPRASATVVKIGLAFAGWLRRHCGMRIGRAIFGRLRRKLGPRLSLLVSGGAALDRDVEDTLLDLGWEVLSGYGLTETSPILTFNRRGTSRPGSAGRPLAGIEIRIARPDAEGIGEIEARGRGVFAGYLGDPGATREAFTPDGWLRTRDLGRLDADGYLHVVARVTETIVLAGGKKLVPEIVEAAYLGRPLIREVAVLARGGALVGLVVPDLERARAEGAGRLTTLIRDTLAAQSRDLPSHARLSGFAVTRQPLPRTPLGKIQRHLLPALYDQALEARRPQEVTVPTAEDAALVAGPAGGALWRWLTARYGDRKLDLDTSPQLDLGIDSLAWVDITLALERDLGITLREAEIARIATLRDLLREAAAAGQREAEAPAATPEQERWLAPSGIGDAILGAVLESGLRVLMRIAFRLQVVDANLLPPSPFLLCANHASYLDPFAIAAALPHRRLRDTYWGGWTGLLFANRWQRLFSRVARVIPVDPDRAMITSLALASVVLARGKNLVWFPEGERSLDGRLLPFRQGIAYVLERNPVAIVPACVSGAFEAWPPGTRFPRRRPITVRFGAALDAARLLAVANGQPRHECIVESVRDAIAQLAPQNRR